MGCVCFFILLSNASDFTQAACMSSTCTFSFLSPPLLESKLRLVSIVALQAMNQNVDFFFCG